MRSVRSSALAIPAETRRLGQDGPTAPSSTNRGLRHLTDERQSRPGQVRPLEDGVEHVLGLAVQLVHLVQNQKPEETSRSGPRLASRHLSLQVQLTQEAPAPSGTSAGRSGRPRPSASPPAEGRWRESCAGSCSSPAASGPTPARPDGGEPEPAIRPSTGTRT